MAVWFLIVASFNVEILGSIVDLVELVLVVFKMSCSCSMVILCSPFILSTAFYAQDCINGLIVYEKGTVVVVVRTC